MPTLNLTSLGYKRLRQTFRARTALVVAEESTILVIHRFSYEREIIPTRALVSPSRSQKKRVQPQNDASDETQN